MSPKIFIIEDDANILASLANQLGAVGFDVIVNEGCGQIETVMEQLMLAEPNYIILDVILPKIDGFRLLKTIKENHEAINATTFVFCDYSDEDTKERCLNLGADYFFLKQDLNVEDFITKIKKIIENRSKSQTALA